MNKMKYNSTDIVRGESISCITFPDYFQRAVFSFLRAMKEPYDEPLWIKKRVFLKVILN